MSLREEPPHNRLARYVVYCENILEYGVLGGLISRVTDCMVYQNSSTVAPIFTDDDEDGCMD